MTFGKSPISMQVIVRRANNRLVVISHRILGRDRGEKLRNRFERSLEVEFTELICLGFATYIITIIFESATQKHYLYLMSDRSSRSFPCRVIFEIQLYPLAKWGERIVRLTNQ
ncbi:hypothetical protein HZ326_3812 [Fusarium oxysporum f. sp. albedinis]|nr:hypothetical protein HZ326_3812 [Fusarium oxysporum f. sp. albedinis]